MRHGKKRDKSQSALPYVALLGLILIVYLFVTAPPSLPDGTPKAAGRQITSYQLFTVLQQENDIMRAQWTKEIVGAGKKQGLKFSEDWEEQGVEAGPLPALFLRATAQELEKHPLPLSLFLGSDQPISQANTFDEQQDQRFQKIKKERVPQFFYAQDIARYTGMFPDIASVKPCVSCHNKHKDSPKKDWKLLDVMGATTWLYPEENVSLEVALQAIAALREKFETVYSRYLEKVKDFKTPPQIGTQWPRSGHYLPNTKTYMEAFEKKASQNTLTTLFGLLKP